MMVITIFSKVLHYEAHLRVFLTAPNMDFDATGESYVAWRWAEALSHFVDLTVFAFQTPGRAILADTLPEARVITEPLPTIFSRYKRFNAMVKPYYPLYMMATRRALGSIFTEIDIAHQIMPLAVRYPTPLRDMGKPYVLGPLGGALPSVGSFRKEETSAAWFTRLRLIDGFRLKFDPFLRRSYSEADLVLGVAPYVSEILRDISLQRFQPLLELGISELPVLPQRHRRTTNVRLLHVGRGVRTKGLRDTIRAMGALKDIHPSLTLDSAGAGEEIDICRVEAAKLGILDRVTFHGLLPRSKVDELYARADVFVFPSYREPTGNVLYEAMSWGLPVITAARGGPDWIVDDDSGIRIQVTEPGKFSLDIADAISALVIDPVLRTRMGNAARAKLNFEALWPTKAAELVKLYEEVLSKRILQRQA